MFDSCLNEIYIEVFQIDFCFRSLHFITFCLIRNNYLYILRGERGYLVHLRIRSTLLPKDTKSNKYEILHFALYANNAHKNRAMPFTETLIVKISHVKIVFNCE